MSGLGRRFMRSDDFLIYAAELGLLDTLPRRMDLLEFLEEERLLMPACRVRFPEGIARRFLNEIQPYYVDPLLEVEPDGPRLDAAAALAARLPSNDGMGLSEPVFHPFDLIDPLQAEFIQPDLVNVPFRPWSEQKVLVGRGPEGGPYYDERNPEHFYHYWQVFVLAELFATRRFVLSTVRAPLSEIPPDRRFVWNDPFRSEGWRGLSAHLNALDAIGIFVAYRSHYLTHATKDQGAVFRLEGEELAEFRRMERACALFAIRWRGLDPSALLRCIEWDADRWNMWNRYGPPRLADEYKTNAVQTIYLYRLVTGEDYDQVIAKLTREGRTLFDQMLPDWVENQKASAMRSLTGWIVPKLSAAAAVGLTVADTDCGAFVDWLSGGGRLQFFLLLEGFGELRELDMRVRLPSLGKTVEGLALTLEHILNDLGAVPGTLKPKMMWLWSNQPNVYRSLKKNWNLTETHKGFAPQQAAIRALSAGNPYDPVVRVLLEVGLIRNQGIHGGFPAFDEDALRDSMEVLLQGVLLIWMNARCRGLV